MKWLSVLVFLLLSAVSCYCSEDEDLLPFIAWSNNAMLSGMQSKDSIDEITSDISKLEAGNVDLVILFNSRILSFASIAQYGDIFEGSSALKHLKSEFELSHSKYWTGYRSVGPDWIAELANRMRLGIRYISDKELKNVSLMTSCAHSNNVIVINLQLDDINNNDNFIKSIMTKVRELKLSYLAIYVGNTKEQKHLIHPRGIDDVMMIRSDSKSSSANNNCPVGGVFNVSDEGSPCMLFCMSNNVTFMPNASNPEYFCSLGKPSNISWCCESDLNLTSICVNETYPFVTVEFVIENVTLYSEDNSCHEIIFHASVFPERPEAPHFENARPQMLVFLKLIFPQNGNSSTWNVVMNVTHSYIWFPQDEVDPDDAPPEDEDEEILSFSSINNRQSPSQNLYLPFGINYGLSYSCSSAEYNVYTVSVSKNSTGTLNGSSVLLHGIQVQPYNVSSNVFSSSDDCTGYLTVTGWMGIISIGLFVLILYVSIIAAFSISPVDQFEDSREQTIKVEKLH